MIKLYTIDCPICTMLEEKLKQKGVEFEKIDNKEFLISLGIQHFPCLEIEEGIIMNTKDSVKYVNSMEDNKNDQ